MKRWFTSPVHLCLVGALVLSIGIYSVVHMIGSFLAGEAEFDLGFILIFVGLGLLRGSSTQRGILGALLALNLVALSVVVVFYVIRGLFFDGELNGINLLGLGVFFAVFCYIFKVLFDAKNDEWFSTEARGKVPPFVIPLTVILTIFYSSAFELRDYQQRKAMSEVYHFDLELRVVDSDTGEVVRNLGTRFGDRDFGALVVPDWMKTSHFGSDSFEGYARESFELRLFAEGYDEEVVMVNRYTDSVVEVSLNPNSSKGDEVD